MTEPVSVWQGQKPADLSKWRERAGKAAKHLKTRPAFGWPKEVAIGFQFDDAIVTLKIARQQILDTPEPELAEWVYQQIIAMAHTEEKS